METLTRKTLLTMYDSVGDFREGLAQAEKDGKWFHIHPDGTPAYRQRYDWVASFHKGLAWARKDGKQFKIRPNGTRAD